MRTLFLVLLVAGVVLLTIGAVVPELFVLSLLGMLVIAGTASVALAAAHHRGPPQAHY
ncbi:hypothetical protein [Blastococcus tunisiensis]|jgi:hypothetical protein|uniref:Uncharacterized protein n=1 Tax=Blastococcus tunisiensis TaxID=1798228 RepID=A0A1I2BVY8_9ACTN|nr:hypothetical protein [Blastococcus sp. DSM 46838]SFE60108.1 hypothetical protein SAMN05216574_104279 [Blastococcus sp. DSM 46838]